LVQMRDNIDGGRGSPFKTKARLAEVLGTG
jgi:hypothetical protein